MRYKLSFFSFFIIFFGIGDAYSQDNDNNRRGFTFSMDQDFFTRGNEDRNYTMGVELTLMLSKHFEKKSYYVIPWLRQRLDILMGLGHIIRDKDFNNPFTSSISLINTAFTPLDLEKTSPIINDRPYASILALGSSRTTAFNENADIETLILKGKYAISTELFIGVLGLSISENIQTYIHKNKFFGSTRPIPLGWSNQISDGGEPTLLYSYRLLKPIFTVEKAEAIKHFESVLDGGMQLGYYTNFSLASHIRFGFFDSDYWSVGSVLNNANQGTTDQKTKKIKWDIIMSARLRYILYNALLQGQFKKNEFELRGSEVSPIVFEASSGLELSICNRFLINYKFINFRSAEFKQAGRNHLWGTISIAYQFNK
jgi:hypothetical protein